jgi:hypothetical protein
MMQGKPRDQWKERKWRQAVRDWQRSGLSVRVFCMRRGLQEASFYAWRRELAKRDRESSTFVPVQVVTEGNADGGGMLEVVLGSGRTIRVAPGFDSATLRQLVAALEEQPPC